MSLVAAGFGAWASDTVMPDGDTAATSPGPNLSFGTGTTDEPCSALGTAIPGHVTVNYNGTGTDPTKHYVAGDSLDVSMQSFDTSHVATSLITTTLGTVPNVPSDWGTNNQESFTIPFTTTVDPSSTGGYVEVTVTDHSVNGYSAGDSSGSGKPFFNVSVDTTACGTIIVGSPPPTNTAPQVRFTSAPATANEGDTKTYTFSFTDPDADTWSFGTGSPSCGTGNTFSNQSINQTAKTGTFDCTFVDGPSTPTVSVAVSDGTATSTAATQSVSVSNVTPTVNSISLSNNTGTACIGGNSVNLGFNFTDPGVIDNPWTPSIDWGDGSAATTTPTVGAQTGAGPWTVATGAYTHAYGAGTFTPAMTLQDKDLAVSSSVSATTGSVSFHYSTGSGILQPINADKSSNFKLGSVFPIKIRISDCNNAPVSGISPKVLLQMINPLDNNNVVNETVASSVPDVGSFMRYDSTAGQWIYNLSSKLSTLVNPAGAPLQLGFYKVTVYDTAGTFTPAVGWFQIVK